MLFASNNFCAAEDLIWHEDKDEVFKIAKEQGKLIFLLVGRETCGNCQGTRRLLNEEPLRPIVDDNYIMWFSDRDNNDRKAEVKIYTDKFDIQSKIQSMLLPFLYIIDPNEPEKYLVAEWGYDKVKAPEILMTLIVEHTTSNDFVFEPEQKVFLSYGTLNIYNNMQDEYIFVHSIEGKFITSFHKKDNRLTIDASRFPKGILVVSSSKRWSSKIINR